MRSDARDETDPGVTGTGGASRLAGWWRGWPGPPPWRRRARDLPADDGGCGWIATLPPPPPPRRLAGDLTADAVVVGAGFTGLAAAHRLAELLPDGRILLLEAQRAGFGAAGRSSGFVVALAHFVARMEPEDADRYVALARRGIDRLRRRVADHGIDCQWDDRGWLHAAASEEAAADLAMLQRWLESRGEPCQHLAGDALREVVGTPYYRAALRLPGSVLVQPAALVRGLAGSLPPAVELYEESPVRAVRRQAGGFLVEAGEGSVRTGRLLLATNGCTPALGFLRRRVLPLFTFGSLTRPLSQAEQQALGGEGEWGLLAEDPMGSTLRRTRDQRLLVRNRVRYTRRLGMGEELRRAMAAVHRRSLAARFPALAEVELEHSWAGLMGVTPSRRHFFGPLSEGLYATAGYTGAGIAMGTAAGELLADLAAGTDSEPLRRMLALPGPGWLPPQPFLGLGAGWRSRRMNAQAGPAD